MSARVAALLTLLPGICLVAAAGPALGAAPPWTQTVSQQALDTGFLTRLPPPVSVAFGLSKPEEGTEVRQLISKDGHHIRTFNVSVANHADLVLYNVNAQTGATVAYLLAPDGKLRKAVSYQTGKDVQPVAAADAQAGLARERHFWSARAPTASTAAPH